jgi:GntR family transcriptional regulator
MEIRGIVDTQQGTGTFIAERQTAAPKQERRRLLTQLVSEFTSRAGAAGLTIEELVDALQQLQPERR